MYFHSKSAKSGDRKAKHVRHSSSWLEEPSDLRFMDEPLPMSSTLIQSSAHRSNETSMMTSMSFATLQIPTCNPREGDDEIDKKSFERWKDLFEAAMEFAGICEEPMKMNAFKMKAGNKLIDMLEGLSNNDTAPDPNHAPYSNAIERLGQFYSSRDYVFLQKQRLQSMTQNPNESDSNYVKRVVEFEKLCGLGGAQMIEAVVDVLQTHAINSQVRIAGRKILRKNGSISDLLDRVRTYEMDMMNERLFAKNHPGPSTMGSVAAVSYGFHSKTETKPRRMTGRESTRNWNVTSASYHQRYWGPQQNLSMFKGKFSRLGNETNSTRVERRQCWRCTSNFHRPENCRALDKRCHKCNIKGHIERACKSNTNINVKRRSEEEVGMNQANKFRKIAAVTESGIDEDPNLDSKPVSDHSLSESA